MVFHRYSIDIFRYHHRCVIDIPQIFHICILVYLYIFYWYWPYILIGYSYWCFHHLVPSAMNSLRRCAARITSTILGPPLGPPAPPAPCALRSFAVWGFPPRKTTALHGGRWVREIPCQGKCQGNAMKYREELNFYRNDHDQPWYFLGLCQSLGNPIGPCLLYLSASDVYRFVSVSSLATSWGVSGLNDAYSSILDDYPWLYLLTPAQNCSIYSKGHWFSHHKSS